MLPPPDAQQRAWMQQWRSAAVALAQVRLAELLQADLARIAAELDDACLAAAKARGDAATSGLVEQQRLFRRGRTR
jgi:SpoU rRNA methylase family enzyme